MTTETTTETTTITVTPTWTGVLPMLIAALRDGGYEAQTVAIEELRKMAKLADVGVEVVSLQRKAVETGGVQQQTGVFAGAWVR